MPKWSWVWGHLLILRHYLSRYPPDTFVTLVMAGIAKDFSETDMFYLDLWPFAPPFLCIGDPDVASQLTSKHTFPKAEYFNNLFEPLMGGPSLLTMNGQEWKDWRTLFNPGFAPSYLLNQVPTIVDYVQVYCDRLKELAKAEELFPLEDVATRMTMDIIIKVTLSVSSHLPCVVI
jgi:cytochrome P450